MKFTILASLVASCAAFAPVAEKASTTALSASKYADALGAQAPLGFFDPLGLLKDADEARFNRLREVEIKHGRISMLAVVGYLVTAAGIRFPGAESMPAGLKAFPATDKIIIIQMVATALIAEIINRDAFGLAEFPGDYRNGYLDFGWDKFDDKTKLRKRSIELNNGRAAMMGITGLVVHESIGNSILPGGVLP